MRRGILAMVAAAGGLLGGAPEAHACGGPLVPFDGGPPPTLAGERALVVFDGKQETIVASLDLNRSTKGSSAIVIPVPNTPGVEAADRRVFSYLTSVTKPRVKVVRRSAPTTKGPPAGSAPGGGGVPQRAPVQVVKRQRIGALDIAVLRAGNPQALKHWLAENGYRAPSGGEGIIGDYIDEGWAFVAVQLAAGASKGSSTPLAMTFPTTRLVYPKRLDRLVKGGVPMELYVLSGHRVVAPGLATRFAGRAAKLDRKPPGALAPLFRRAPFLTKLTGEPKPVALKSDLYPRRARSDRPYRQTVIRYVYR